VAAGFVTHWKPHKEIGERVKKSLKCNQGVERERAELQREATKFHPVLFKFCGVKIS